MAKNHWLLTVAVTLLAVAAVRSPASADSPDRPTTYTHDVPGGKYVFVMIYPGAVGDDVLRTSEAAAARIREIRHLYPRSGLYPKDGFAEPLWTVDWYAAHVEVAADGVHLIRHGPWPPAPEDRTVPLGEGLDCEALSFFASGRQLRTYTVRELVSDPDRLYRSVSHFMWLEASRLDDARLEYHLVTKDGSRFAFDLRTGGITTEERAPVPPRVAHRGWWVGLGVLAAAVAAGIGWRVWSRARSAKAELSTPPDRGGR
jgi:hypothetical protein